MLLRLGSFPQERGEVAVSRGGSAWTGNHKHCVSTQVRKRYDGVGRRSMAKVLPKGVRVWFNRQIRGVEQYEFKWTICRRRSDGWSFPAKGAERTRGKQLDKPRAKRG